MLNSRQMGLFDGHHSKSAHISIKEKHELVQLTELTPWAELIEAAQGNRASKVKALVGPEPHYRELLGAIALMSVRQVTYRQAEDLIAHYAPARYLCKYPNEVGLMKRFTDLTVSTLKKVGGKFSGLKARAKEIAGKVKGLVRRSHLFAKTKEQKREVGKKLYHTAKELHGMIKLSTELGLKIQKICG